MAGESMSKQGSDFHYFILGYRTTMVKIFPLSRQKRWVVSQGGKSWG